MTAVEELKALIARLEVSWLAKDWNGIATIRDVRDTVARVERGLKRRKR